MDLHLFLCCRGAESQTDLSERVHELAAAVVVGQLDVAENGIHQELTVWGLDFKALELQVGVSTLTCVLLPWLLRSERVDLNDCVVELPLI